MCSTTVKQNCLYCNGKFYIQKGLQMGDPHSSLFSEISLKDLQHASIINILTKYNTVAYNVYANDILIW